METLPYFTVRVFIVILNIFLVILLEAEIDRETKKGYRLFSGKIIYLFIFVRLSPLPISDDISGHSAQGRSTRTNCNAQVGLWILFFHVMVI